jgi:hypothetical protein
MFNRSVETQEAFSHLGVILGSMPLSRIEEKKSCLHVIAGKAAFLGVHPRKGGLRLNIVLARPLQGARVVKAEQVSRARYHNEVDVAANDFDAELLGWISEAYELQTT